MCARFRVSFGVSVGVSSTEGTRGDRTSEKRRTIARRFSMLSAEVRSDAKSRGRIAPYVRVSTRSARPTTPTDGASHSVVGCCSGLLHVTLLRLALKHLKEPDSKPDPPGNVTEASPSLCTGNV